LPSHRALLRVPHAGTRPSTGDQPDPPSRDCAINLVPQSLTQLCSTRTVCRMLVLSAVLQWHDLIQSARAACNQRLSSSRRNNRCAGIAPAPAQSRDSGFASPDRGAPASEAKGNFERMAAGNDAAQINGVKTVVNDIELKSAAPVAINPQPATVRRRPRSRSRVVVGMLSFVVLRSSAAG